MGMVFGFGLGLGFSFGFGLGCWGGSWSFSRFPLSFATFLAFGALFAFKLALGLAFGRFSFGVNPFAFAAFLAILSFASFGSFVSFTTSRGAASSLDEVFLRLVNGVVDKGASVSCITSRASLCPPVTLWCVSVFAAARLLEVRTMTFGDPFPARWGVGIA